MKLGQDIRREFKNQFIDTSFTMDDVKKFLEPFFEWDEEKAKEKAKTQFARKFIQSFKDGEGVREALAYNISDNPNGPEQIAYSFFDECNEVEIIKKQKMKIEGHIQGLFRTKQKLSHRQWVLEHQMTIFDFGVRKPELGRGEKLG